jgi:hypothetical protein
MFRKEIKPLSESMIDAIGNTINKLEYVEEKVNVKGIQKAIDDGKSMDEIMTMFANKRTTNTDEIRKVAKEYMWKKRKMKEEVEGLEEARTLSASDFEGEDPPKGIDYDTSNLRKVNWKLYDDKELKTLLNQIDERLKYEDGGAYEEAILKAIRAEMKKRGLKEEVEGLEEADANSIGQALMKKHGEGSKVVKKSGRYYIKYTKNNNEVIIGPFNDLDDVMKDLKEEVELDEISKKTLVNYMDKSKKQTADIQKKFKKGTETKDDEKTFDKRVSGQIKALDKFHGRSKVPASGVDKAYDAAQKSMRNEEVDIDESYTELSILKKRIARDTKKMKSLPDFHPQKKKIAILVAKDKKRLDDLFKKQFKNEEFELEEKMDPVGKADADINNDGNVDSSDKYLHARRKAISKAMKKRKMNEQDTKMGTITVNSDEERKKRAAAYRAKKMKSEEVELDESDKTSLKKHIEKLKKMYKDEEKKNKARNNPYSSPEMSQIAQAIDVYEKRLKEEVELDEAKSATGYTIYHKTFSSAVQHAISQVEKQGYTVDEDEWDRKVAMGPKKPSAGKTNSYTIPLLKNGKPTPRKLQMQVYYDEGRYELNMYIS